MEKFKQGDKFILTLGKPSDIYPKRWEVETTDMVFPKMEVPESFFYSLPRYEEPAEGVEVPDVVFQVMIARADELSEQVKALEKERDKIMNFLHSAKRSHEG